MGGNVSHTLRNTGLMQGGGYALLSSGTSVGDIRLGNGDDLSNGTGGHGVGTVYGEAGSDPFVPGLAA